MTQEHLSEKQIHDEGPYSPEIINNKISAQPWRIGREPCFQLPCRFGGGKLLRRFSALAKITRQADKLSTAPEVTK